MLYSTLLYCTLLYCTLLYSIILYITLLYFTILYSTLPYSTKLFYTILFIFNLTLLYYFIGAETGTGGRLRDVQATGRGANTLAGISSYCVGNLQIPSYLLPWEDSLFEYPTNLASPLRIIVEASNGASDYGKR